MGAPAPLRLLTYNMHKGMSPLNRYHHLPDMAGALSALDLDILLLQEVQGRHHARALKHAQWPARGQHHYLARHLGMRAAYGMNAAYEVGHHGNAVLSRFPIRDWCNLDISVNRFERRGVLHCVLSPPGWPVPLVILCLHLNLLGRDREKQYLRVADYIRGAVPPSAALIVAGDFNDWRGEASDRLGRWLGLDEAHAELHGEHALTFPARLPILPLDRVYMRGVVCTEAQVVRTGPWRALSDHLPVLVSITPKGGRETSHSEKF